MADISAIKLPDGNTYDIIDSKVLQSASTSNTPQPILFRNNVASGAVYSTEGTRYTDSVTITPSTGMITATKFNNYTLAAACEKSVDTSISAASTSTQLPTSAAVAAFVEGKGYLTSYTETDPVFSASAAAGITATDIDNWNAKVSDTGKWNNVTLNKSTVSETSRDTVSIPLLVTASSTTAFLMDATFYPSGGAIPRYDANSYLNSKTPSANDNSTKVATTAYVDSAIPTVPTNVSAFTNDAGYLTSFTESDPTVPAWAKASSKPTYTASEVGAQPTLVSGTNIKTVNNESLLGSGNITIDNNQVFIATPEVTTYEELLDAIQANQLIYLNIERGVYSFSFPCSCYYNPTSGIELFTVDDNILQKFTISTQSQWTDTSTNLQARLISGTNIKTINNQSLLGSGDVTITETDPTVPSWAKASTKPSYTASEINGLLDFFYPVGSYYETSDTTFDPNVSWGGTWYLEVEGQVHVSSGRQYTVTGADITHYIGPETVVGTSDGGNTTSATGNHTLTAAESGIRAHGHGMSHNHSHNHASSGGNADYFLTADETIYRRSIKPGTSTAVTNNYYGAGSIVRRQVTDTDATGPKDSSGASKTTTDNNTAGNATAAHNHGSVSTMQPYIVVNRWHRTA